MKRHKGKERPNYVQIVNEQGLVYTHEDPNGNPLLYRYWRDGEWYSFTLAEINVLETAAAQVFEMCIEAGDWLLSSEGKPYLDRFGIPTYAMKAVINSWNEEPACGSVYGRFDFRFGGLDHPDPGMRTPKLYEFNADTPTSLVESLVQWYWLENTGHGPDQFNSIFEKLVAAWKRNLAAIESKIGFRPIVWFASTSDDPSHEDEMNTKALLAACLAVPESEEAAREAKERGEEPPSRYQVKAIAIENVWCGADGRWYSDSTETEHLDVIFKLNPWEQMTHTDASEELFADMDNAGYGFDNYRGGTIWIEPPYKLLWSTKALLPVLWKLFGADPERAKHLIPSWFEDEAPMRGTGLLAGGFARKPILSREGADITLVLPGDVIIHGERQGYGEEGYVIQALAEPPKFKRFDDLELVPEGEYREVYTVLGLWMIDGEPAGLCVRESAGPITDNFANFIPHVISDGERVAQLTPPAPLAMAGN